MVVTELHEKYAEDAARLANAAYQAERRDAPALPERDYSIELLPALRRVFSRRHGVVALEGDRLLGYLSFFDPRDGQFGRVRGAYSPLYANAVTNDVSGDRRERVASQLFEQAARSLVQEGVHSYALTVYAHDRALLKSFVLNGFGIRCADAVRDLGNPLPVQNDPDYVCAELSREEALCLLPLHNQLANHLRQSPTFLLHGDCSHEEFLEMLRQSQSRFFVIRDLAGILGYLEVTTDGETFVSESPEMLNLCGAYLRPEERGKGLAEQLLAFVIARLRADGVRHLGVDCETLNPTALHFWSKHFDTYTYSLVRRLDERLW